MVIFAAGQSFFIHTRIDTMSQRSKRDLCYGGLFCGLTVLASCVSYRDVVPMTGVSVTARPAYVLPATIDGEAPVATLPDGFVICEMENATDFVLRKIGRDLTPVWAAPIV